MRRILHCLALGTALAGPAPAQYAAIDLVWAAPLAEPGAPRPCVRMLVLTAPRDWADGDAAVLVLAPEGMARQARALAEVLVAQQAAVLDYASGFGGCEVAATVAPDPVGEALGGLVALKEAGAGLVVAIGLGPAGAAALAAAREEAAARFLGPGGPRFVAAMALMGAGPAAFRLGQAPVAGDRWPERAPLLCAAVAAPEGPAALAACRAAFAPAQGQAALGGGR